MLEKNKKDFEHIKKNNNRKKQSKLFRDDDTYGESKVNKEFKRRKQNLKEEDDWEEWEEYYNQ